MTKMTKEYAENLGLYNIDKWLGAKGIEDFKVDSLDSILGMPKGTSPLTVVTTKDCYLGAACLTDIEFIDTLAENMNANLIILPSSIHEILVIPMIDEYKATELTEIINQVNTSCIEPEIRLGDKPLFYEKGSFEIINY